jgi:elongation factor P--(R)-beta-lysine ligase
VAPEGHEPGVGSRRVFSPHEVGGDDGAALASRQRVGGRLILEAGGWSVADALCALPVRFADASRALHAALAIVEGVLEGGVLVGAQLLEVYPSEAPPLEWQRLFHSGAGPRLALRARLCSEVRHYFASQGFVEVDTPLRSAECGTETHVEPIRSGESYLITSPELHMKRLLVGGIPRLFQLVHCFRAGERGRLHSPEFLMLEWYRAFEDYTAVLEDTERLVHALQLSVTGGPWLTLPSGKRVDLSLPFVRLGVREAFARFAGVADAVELAATDEDRYFQLLVDQVEPAIAELGRPVFLCDYPASQAALARLCPSDPSVAERFELYVGDVELCNGYGELTDPLEQRARCESDRRRRLSLGRAVPAVPERFVGALSQGMPPASGNALGLDRLLMLLTGQASIDDVVPFASEDA